MLTRDRFLAELETSQRREEQTYKELTQGLYRGLQSPLKALYDEMVSATANLTAVTAQAIQDHPEIIKILRYCLAPVISQMRLGQIIGIKSTGPFEKGGAKPAPQQAADLVRWFINYLDRERFPWTEPTPPAWSEPERRIAEHYAKLCTVALVSNQNTATQYRNRRQEMQERAIANALEGMGLLIQQELGPPATPKVRRKKGEPPAPLPPRRPAGIHHVEDVRPGHYVREKTILAGFERNQKSDLTARPGADPKLFCIEAKAVGIRIDSAKRLKELNDKFTDWQGSALPIVTIGICAGFFNPLELIATIRVRGIPIFFEHDLTPLADFLRHGEYFGSPWNPQSLFLEVPPAQLQAAIEKIATTSTEDETDADSEREAVE
ncbi:MAG TPA: XamI family restriction endonuclease [Gemmataceae bacterium]|nr:XamI family restriction endonuclease [Gemmataceae bacterium]